ncbi:MULTISPECIES: hypothetical protein [unclassified Synechococcus]|uniref:hypothetical protein n=1 Tax=unclassified Synechococcus TaxID=2626047 RepID=UPI000B686F53|nr:MULTISPECIES: hypothetical protein [unclassified Synechococcus]MAS26850.1 hypothetical protein [Synechococcus sp. NAT40]OUW47287.1 MAG: hypothetical protein CBD47_04860 [Synechococcus sp. TMED187]RZO12640.1 MAG: hypothetical protein EVB08_07610 [Synechococcus sp. MED-G135]
MTFFTCFDDRGGLIARCQTQAEVEALRRRGRPIASVQPMKPQEAVVCGLTSSPAEYDEEL